MNPLRHLFGLAILGSFLMTAQGEEPKAALLRVEGRIKPLLSGLSPAPSFTFPQHTQSLEVGYRTQRFLVHGRSMTGEWSTNAFENVGPSSNGFILRVHLQRLGEVNQLVTPQAIHEPYWHTYLQETPIAGTTNQIYWALSYGDHAEEKILVKLKQALGSLAINDGGRQRKAQ